ncbi:AAA family ATPase [Limibacillus sp. MBR-115]|jgi:wobble nucleotide-excising tRNase|uniref:AAA family ATPase n=1 Tax=Limibacillus sp. MBR-115 TaxID=3156465 RepID=UPI00339A5D3D
MPIKKFLSVKNVGRLVNCAQKGPELNRYNLFFAENGRGKTTLCAVLRSLQTGEHEHITERTTIAPVASDPEAAIRLDAGTATYKTQAWSGTAPEIAIFDATFVARNVHAGEYVSRDHRTNLLQVIIGETGVKLAEAVNKLDESIREKNSEIGRAKKAIQPHLPNGAKLEQFLDLAEDPDIDNKIAAKTKGLGATKQAEQIRTRSALSQASVPVLPDDFDSVLSKTLADVSADAETRLREQIDRHEMHERGQAWISEGLGYIRNESCPFCGQSTKGLALVDAYKQFFSESYAALIDEIDALATAIDSAFGDTALATLGTTFANNEAGAQFWKQFAAIDVNEVDHEGAVAAPARALRKAALALVESKRKSPLTPISADEEFKTAKAKYDKAAALLQGYNKEIAAANTAVSEQKERAKTADPAAIEKEIAGLGLIKLRHDPKVKPLCTEYQTLNADKKKLDDDKAAAKDKLDNHADRTISAYEKTINKLLDGFGAGFSITNSKKTYVGGTPSSVYQILINKHAVDLGDGTTPSGQPCFRTTLSAGDKSTLALAFFLAQLDHDPRKADRIVVFDDPFNSQDRSRRERTAELLKKYGRECAQLLLLSHDPHFLNLVHTKLPKAERHALQLSRAPDNATTIEEWDVEKETQDGYFKDHAALSSYRLNGAKDLIDIARKIRPVLEGYHRYRFPHQFPDNEWLGDMIRRIRDSAGVHPMHPALEELESINDFSKKYHHDTNPGKADNEPINDGELQGYVQRTLAIVGGY